MVSLTPTRPAGRAAERFGAAGAGRPAEFARRRLTAPHPASGAGPTAGYGGPLDGGVASGLGKGLQSPVQGFDSLAASPGSAFWRSFVSRTDTNERQASGSAVSRAGRGPGAAA